MPGETTPLSRRNLLVGGGLLVASGIAYARQPHLVRQRLAKGRVDAMIPTTIGPWQFESSSGLVLPPPDAFSDRIYDEIVTRVYEGPGVDPVMLLIAYSNTQDGMLQVHRPETCYPVGGFALSDSHVVDIAIAGARTLPCRFFTAESAQRVEQVLYWTRIGDYVPSKWVEQRWAVVNANLKGEIPDGLLVRMSSLNPDAGAALITFRNFAKTLTEVIAPAVQKLLTGQ